MTSSPHPRDARIAVVGAGPAGLTVANVLWRYGIAASVYEKDGYSTTRDHGSAVDLQADEGQLALQNAGLLQRFHERSRPRSRAMRWLHPYTAEIGAQHVPDPGERHKPEIDRGVLREILLDGLPPGIVQWGHALQAIKPAADGRTELRFRNGRVIDTDLVIGADGAFSKVRTAISATRPDYTGITFLEARFDDIDTRHPELSALAGDGSTAAADGERGIYLQRHAGQHLRAYIIQRRRHDWLTTAHLAPDDTTAIRHHLLDIYAAWSPRFHQVLTDSDGRFIDRPLFTLPTRRWPRSTTITLLGDAAHLMPAVGGGVNLAMLDAHQLARSLAAAETIEHAITTYEQTTRPHWEATAAAATPRLAYLLDARNLLTS